MRDRTGARDEPSNFVFVGIVFLWLAASTEDMLALFTLASIGVIVTLVSFRGVRRFAWQRLRALI